MNLSNIPLACIALLPAVAPVFQPLVTDDTGTQGTGGNQIEASYSRVIAKAPGARDITHGMPLVFTRGIADALDLYGGAGYQRIAPTTPAAVEHGWGNPAIGAKWRFYESEASKLSFALKPEVRFPVSKNREMRGLGAARASYAAGLLITQGTGFGAVHANAVVERVNCCGDTLNSAERRALHRLSVAPVWNVAESVKLAFDAGVMTNPNRLAKARMGYVEFGAIYLPDKDLEFALGVVREVMDGDARTTQLTAGLTWRFR